MEVAQLSERRQALEQALLRAYTAYFDIQPGQEGDALRAVCSYHSRDAQYVLVKKAELWAAESHEYLYLYSLSHLDAEQLVRLWDHMLADGTPKVRPHAQHMYTYLTAVVLYDSADPQALQQLKKLKQRREFKLSLHGWMESRIAAVDCSTADLTANRAGKAMSKDLKRLVERIISKQNGEEKNQ